MGVTSSEQVKRIQQVIETLEEKKMQYDHALSKLNRTKLQIQETLKNAEKDFDAAESSLEQARIQLEKELLKFDPVLFLPKRGEDLNAERERAAAG